MFHYSCTKAVRKLRRLGYAKKGAARFVGIFRIIMAILCGLVGVFFEIPEELSEPTAIAGKKPADSRQGTLLPAVFAIHR